VREYERLHGALDDGELDAIARIAGLASGIGRLSYLDDATLGALVREIGLAKDTRVLDLGCGRGFVGRWLLANGYHVDYTAIDESQSALAAVRRSVAGAHCVHGNLLDASGGPFDAIFAVESLWSIDASFAARLRELLATDGYFLATFASLGAMHEARMTTSLDGLAAAGFEVRRIPLPTDHAAMVGRLCASTAIEPPSDPWVRERLVGEAYATLAALRDNEFHYDVMLAKRLDAFRTGDTKSEVG